MIFFNSVCAIIEINVNILLRKLSLMKQLINQHAYFLSGFNNALL